MTKENAKDFLVFINALAEGKTIQVLCSGGAWVDSDEPAFSSSPEHYRIKPEPREWYLVEDNGHSAGVYFARSEAESRALQLDGEVIHVREVLP